MEHHYPRLYLMAALSFAAMFILMYAMVDRFDDVYLNLNQAYMAGLMAAPMVIIELLVMKMMYPDKRKNLVLLAISVAAGVLFWVLIRQQVGVGNAQFLRSMIPHHGGAVLMCGKLRADDAEIRRLCRGIIESQEREIAEMKAALARVD
jgi:dipeptide/tripeptide permease